MRSSKVVIANLRVENAKAKGKGRDGKKKRGKEVKGGNEFLWQIPCSFVTVTGTSSLSISCHA